MQARILEAEKFLAELSRTDSLAKIVKVSKVTNGVDLQIGGKRAAKLLAGKFVKESREKIAVSSTLAGIDRKGHDWSRFTYCVRL
jgi:NMD protein affecting ribosome stability and mRNA decay